jgi:hypothetical protein
VLHFHTIQAGKAFNEQLKKGNSMFKKTVLIDGYALEEIGAELGYSYAEYSKYVQELDATAEDGVFITEFEKSQLKNYKKSYSENAIKILEGFFDKHKIEEFTIVATA